MCKPLQGGYEGKKVELESNNACGSHQGAPSAQSRLIDNSEQSGTDPGRRVPLTL